MGNVFILILYVKLEFVKRDLEVCMHMTVFYLFEILDLGCTIRI